MTAAVRAIPTVRAPGTAAALVAVAKSQVGVMEGHDSSGWDNDNPYGLWFGMNGVSWCAEFVTWAAAHSGCGDVIPRYSYTPAGAEWFRSKGQWGRTPKVGAIGFVYGFAEGRIHHTFIVAEVHADGTFTTVEGNTNTSGGAQGSGVFSLHRTLYSLGTLGGFGYPKYRVSSQSKTALGAVGTVAGATAAAFALHTSPAPAPAAPVKRPAPVVVPLHAGVKPGRHAAQVKVLQRDLHAGHYGHLSGSPTDFYGPATQAAVRAFHKKHPQFGTAHDSAIGPKGFRYLQIHSA